MQTVDLFRRVSKKCIGVLLLAIPFSVFATWENVNMPVGVTEISRETYWIHMMVIWLCVAIAVIVFGLMFYSIFKFRKSKGAKPDKNLTHSTKLEVIWTVIPILILVGLAFPAIETLGNRLDTSKSDVEILITGHQWKWQYTYLDHDINYFSNLATPRDQIEGKAAKSQNYILDVDNPLVIPTGKKIKFLVTAKDVMHSWWVPQFAVKQDAVPGLINETWTNVDVEGTYYGQCAELCGINHGFMPIKVEAVSNEEYKNWVQTKLAENSQQASQDNKVWTNAELKSQGKKIYERSCAACHQVNGQGVPPAFPKLAGSEYVNGDVEAVIDVVVNGRTGTAMQAFGQQLSKGEIASVLTYIRSAWGNNASEVQPSQIK